MGVQFLSQEWCELQTKLAATQPIRPGATLIINYVVTGTPNGDAKYFWDLEDGRLRDCGLGHKDGAEVTLSMAYVDSMRMQKGSLDSSTAFMQGRVKVTGNMAKVMALLPITNSDEFQQFQSELSAATEY